MTHFAMFSIVHLRPGFNITHCKVTPMLEFDSWNLAIGKGKGSCGGGCPRCHGGNK